MQILISIIVPVYQVEQYIHKCIDSILRQTYSYFEIILVNDGSTDRCPEICDEYANRDLRIKTIHQTNAGVSFARNVGLNNATGEYILFIDPDDWIEEDTLEFLIDKIKNLNYDIVLFDSFWVYPTGEITKHIKQNNNIEKINSETALKYMLKDRKVLYGICGKIFKRSLFLKENISFNTKIAIAEDVLINYYLFSKAKSILYCSDAKYYHFQRQTSVMNSEFNAKSYISGLLAWKTIIEELIATYPQMVGYGKSGYVEYIVIMINKILQNNKVSNKKIFLKLQKKIRKNISSFLLLPSLSIKNKIYLIVYLLPYRQCLFMNKLTNSLVEIIKKFLKIFRTLN